MASAVRLPIVGGDVTVDEDSADLVRSHRWAVVHGRYARTSIRSKNVYLHRAILGLVPGDGVVADHINGDGLDNRRANLRAVGPHENAVNRRGKASGAFKAGNGWIARITCRGRVYYLGYFKSKRKAYVTYKRVERRLFAGVRYELERERESITKFMREAGR